MSKPKNDLEYLHYNLSGLYLTTQRENRLYFGIQDDAIKIYFAKFMRIKS